MARVLILWNMIDDDVYEHYRRDDRRSPDWDPSLVIEPWDTVVEEVELLVDVLREGGHEAAHLNIRDSFDTLLASVTSGRWDCVMNLVEYYRDDPEQENNVPALFELLGVQYTGNRPGPLALCQKKPLAKALLTSVGLPTPRGIVIERATERARRVPAELDLRYPMMVKPAHDDASGGIDTGSVVHDRAALEARVHHLLDTRSAAVLVEEFIAGREIHCAILGNEPLPLYEMKFKGGVDDEGRALPHIITYRTKWDPYSREHFAVENVCPADLREDQVAEIQAVAMKAYRAIGCRDYARVDMRLEAGTGKVYILEVNPNPDLSDTCAFAHCVRASGRTYGQAINQLVQLALDRAAAKPARYLGPTDILLDEHLARRAAGGTK